MMNVSAIVPIYNSVNTLKKAIQSLLIQPEIDEIFIVDDGSSDGSFELAKELESRYALINVLTHEKRKNKGAAASRNLGLKHCKNEWVQFLDADDELLPNKISINIKSLSSDCSFLVGNSIFNKGGKIYKRHYWINTSIGLLVTRLGVTSSNLWCKSSLNQIGGWNEDLSSSQEYDLMLRLIKLNLKVSFCADYLSIIHELPSSISRNKSLNNERLVNSIRFRESVKEYLIRENQFGFLEKMYYHGVLGSICRKYNLTLTYSIFFYYLFKIYKSFSDRILSPEYTIN
ncbi:glycosyltransferase family 2 protein [Algoriphagus taiwanensis]|uniref:Glycosyltransferase 2-like domain-containing protein n=1 Tax=Algoriphagus taiwanensis TaxID=1445656 RepID=A0ABQ6Q815_9BACT|nr:hypothetical protein Ataiwa_39980 [Algoriphagus taiwanensis]